MKRIIEFNWDGEVEMLGETSLPNEELDKVIEKWWEAIDADYPNSFPEWIEENEPRVQRIYIDNTYYI